MIVVSASSSNGTFVSSITATEKLPWVGIVLLFALAVHGDKQKTFGDVKQCMEVAMKDCKTTCAKKIDAKYRSKVTACFDQLETEIKAQRANCSADGPPHPDDSAPCFAPPSPTGPTPTGDTTPTPPGPHGGPRGGPFEMLARRYPDLKDAAECMAPCMQDKVKACHDGCTAARPPRPSGRPPFPSRGPNAKGCF